MTRVAPSNRHSHDVDAIYVVHRRLLCYVARERFRIPADDAEALVHDVMLAFLTAQGEVENVRAWLVAATCNASRAYCRTRSHFVEIDSIGSDLDGQQKIDIDECERRLLAREVIAALPARDRDVLRLHYFEQLTAVEIASRLMTTPRYAEKLISRALRRARKLFDLSRQPRSAAADQEEQSTAGRQSPERLDG